VTAVINKSDDLSHIGLAIANMMRGREYIGPSVRVPLDSMGLSACGQQRDVVLSKRELEVVRLFVSDMTITEIAAQQNAALKPSAPRKTPPCANWVLNVIQSCFNRPKQWVIESFSVCRRR
jgi:two-component system capsular synthesis response regulator RcsB